MFDLLIAKSAVEKRRMARKNVIIATFTLIISLALMSLGKILSMIGLLGLFYTIYKVFLKAFYAFGFIRSEKCLYLIQNLKPLFSSRQYF